MGRAAGTEDDEAARLRRLRDMMRLFGGFETRTFEADSSAFPLGPGWAEHVALGHVDPLLVHVCLFAGNDVG